MVDSAMAVGPEWPAKQVEKASPDLLREMVMAFVTALMGAEVDAVSGAGFGVNTINLGTAGVGEG